MRKIDASCGDGSRLPGGRFDDAEELPVEEQPNEHQVVDRLQDDHHEAGVDREDVAAGGNTVEIFEGHVYQPTPAAEKLRETDRKRGSQDEGRVR